MQNTEPGIFCLGERTGQKIPNPNAQAGMMNGQISLQQQFGAGARMPGVNPQIQQQNAAIAAQQAAMSMHRGGGAQAKPMQVSGYSDSLGRPTWTSNSTVWRRCTRIRKKVHIDGIFHRPPNMLTRSFNSRGV